MRTEVINTLGTEACMTHAGFCVQCVRHARIRDGEKPSDASSFKQETDMTYIYSNRMVKQC